MDMMPVCFRAIFLQCWKAQGGFQKFDHFVLNSFAGFIRSQQVKRRSLHHFPTYKSLQRIMLFVVRLVLVWAGRSLSQHWSENDPFT